MSRGNRNWTPAPEHYYQDVSSELLNQDTDSLRKLIHEVVLPSLIGVKNPHLVLPPRQSSHEIVRDDIRRNEFVEVGIVIQGAMSLWWEGEITHCATGAVVVIPSDMPYLPHATCAGQIVEPHSVLWLALHRSCVIAHVCVIDDDRHFLSTYYSFGEAKIGSIGRAIDAELKEISNLYKLVVLGELIGLLTRLLRAPVEEVAKNDFNTVTSENIIHHSLQEAVESFILSHYHRPVLLEQIANAVGQSPTHVCRRYRQITGQTPFQFLRDVRVSAAKRLLAADIPIGRVAAMVGFEDPLYFSRVFSGQVGESPHKYRLRYRLPDVVREKNNWANEENTHRILLEMLPVTHNPLICVDVEANTSIEFRNKTNADIKLFLFSYDMICVRYATVKSGQDYIQRTVVDHSWIVTTEDEQPIGMFVAAPIPGIAEIR